LSVAGYDQPKRVAAIAYGPAAEEQWGQPARNVDYFDVKADLEALFAPKTLRFIKVEHPALHPGRSAQIMLDGQEIGFIGELHPRWQQKYDLPLAPVLFEVDAGALRTRDVPAYREILKFPAVVRDIAVVVKQSVRMQDLMDTFVAARQSNPACDIMQAIVLFDEYRGKGLENDEKSLAFRFTLQDTQTTLQDDKVDAAMAAFIASVEKKHGAKLRTK
jgi:phenylalanyl-tRNA synthetase beta chain